MWTCEPKRCSKPLAVAGRELTALEWRTYFGEEPQVETCEDVLPG